MRNSLRGNFILMVLLFSIKILAQTPASVSWSLTLSDSQKVSAVTGNLSGFTQTSSPGFVVRDYANGPGPDQRWWPFENGSAVPWGAETTQVNTRWVQFAVLPNASFNFHAENLSIYLGGKGTDGLRANVAFSLDENFSSSTQLNDTILVLKKDSDSLYSFELNEDVVDGKTLYVRVYPWYAGASSTSKYLYMRMATIAGTTKAVTYPASAKWELSDPGIGGTGTTVALSGQVSALDELLNNLKINQYTGPGQSQRLKLDTWPANQTTRIDSVYIQFVVTPKAGFNFTATGISLGIAAASINTMKAGFYYSTDPTFSNETKVEYKTLDSVNNYLSITDLLPVSISLNEKVDPGETFYFRIYPWVDNDPVMRTGKYVCLQNVLISGEIEGTSNPAVVEWPFESGDGAVITGALLAKNQTYSSAMKYAGEISLKNSDGVDVTAGTIQLLSPTWVIEPNPVDSIFFQYAVSPKFGGTFFVDNISLCLGSRISKTIKAAVYYSTDPSFSTKKLLIGDTLLKSNSLMRLHSAIQAAISTGETFYLRVYPHNTLAEDFSNSVLVDSVIISGFTIGVTFDLPTVVTANISNLSTTFVSSGGNISTDGGSPITAKGVAWNKTGSATINESKTENGSGSGSFVSLVVGLTPGTNYFLRAYASNEAGTSYGAEKQFRTLDSTSVPTVVTAAVTNILVKTAECGGVISNWGGDTIKVKGVVWNTTGNPTLLDNKTENGIGPGSFTSTLFPLQENTKYYVRAYAANNVGTGYGMIQSFTTKIPQPAVQKIVAKDGSGDYLTVQEAFAAVPDFYTGEYRIFVKKGLYQEKLFLDRNKVNVVLQGEDRDSTILTYDDYSGKIVNGVTLGTSTSYSVAIDGDDFVARDITFQNTSTIAQAVALRSNGFRQAYYNCNLLGYQDTYYTWGGRGTARTYHKNCYIEGSVDFIFGRNIAVFDSCTLNINRDAGTLTAASTEPESKFGYVFRDCKIKSDSIGFDGKPIVKFYLGRPWQQSPRTVFINCEEPATLDPTGWLTWNVTPGLYAEYKCFGPGALTSNRLTSISRSVSENRIENGEKK